MSVWLKLVVIGLIIAVIGGIAGVYTSKNASDYANIAWGVCAVGIVFMLIGFVSKVKHMITGHN